MSFCQHIVDLKSVIDCYHDVDDWNFASQITTITTVKQQKYESGTGMQPSELIRTRRKELGLSLEHLAARLTLNGWDTQKQSVSFWEKGRNQPPLRDPRFRNALAYALDLETNDMMQLMGFVSSLEDQYSPEARLAAQLVDHMPENMREIAIDMLKTLDKRPA